MQTRHSKYTKKLSLLLDTIEWQTGKTIFLQAICYIERQKLRLLYVVPFRMNGAFGNTVTGNVKNGT